ncbi:MAG TPA: fatty acid-binding protein DegV [Erysipelotrichaceae bacterium]|jgi:DegV family protein with EDD domain|nr:fatty acid-binding protein DegV [Erysipelotrichaceae bacterium]
MMRDKMKLKLVTDSNCDLPLEFVYENQIAIMPFNYSIEGTEYLDDFGESLPYTEFYKKIRSGLPTTTSQIPPTEFEALFLEYVKAGLGVIYISFSSALSGTYNNACFARANILESYPDANIAVIDSLRASSGQGLLVYKAASLLKKGKTFHEIVELLEVEKLKIRTVFTVDSLEHLRRGGRLSTTSAVFGYLLEIKPLLEMNTIGELIPIGKVRGRKKSINFLFDSVIAEIDDSLELVIIINHADCYGEASELRDRIQIRFKSAHIILNDLCPTIGSHSGPGTIAVAYTIKKSSEGET